MPERFSPANIACVQMDVKHGDVRHNLDHAAEMTEKAHAMGANVIVLPELFNSGIAFSSRAEAYSIAERADDSADAGASAKFIINTARSLGVYLTGSITELDGTNVYNTALLAGPDGYIGKFRKLHPCEDEVYSFEPGDLGLPVFNTPIGRIGLLICLDAYYPETFRILALQKADLVCVMFNASDVKASRNLPDPYHTMAGTLCMAGALSNHIIVACCNRVGTGGSTKFAGQSVIAGPWGNPIAMGDHEKEEIVYAEVDLADSRRKYFHPTNSRLANRRTDVYSADLGYRPEMFGKM